MVTALDGQMRQQRKLKQIASPQDGAGGGCGRSRVLVNLNRKFLNAERQSLLLGKQVEVSGDWEKMLETEPYSKL